MQDKLAAMSNKLPAAGAPRAPRASRQRQRQRLIDACISALHLYGPSRTTVEKVVAIANLSPGIVRFYFDSKDAMLVASLGSLAAEFEERVLVPVARLKGTPGRALERLVDLYLDPEIASPRKVSVWYSFWGEASSRQEYHDICGKKDVEFAVLVRELIEGVIAEVGCTHLDADAVALGLIGVLEVLWQSFAFQSEVNIDRAAARRRTLAYLGSVFPGKFAAGAASGPPRQAGTSRRAAGDGRLPAAAYADAGLAEKERERLFRPSWQVVGLSGQLARGGAFLTAAWPWDQVLVVRTAAGELHALRNACGRQPHALLETPSGRLAGKLQCADHGLTYDLDGRLLEGAAPGDLTPLELRGLGPLLLVRSPHIDGAVVGDAAAVAVDDWPALQVVRTEALAAAADWKLMVEQWLERRTPGRHFLAPNQLIDLGEAPQILQVLPEGVARTRIVRWVLRRAGAAERVRPSNAELTRQIQLAESTQRGLEALPAQAQDAGPLTPELASFRRSIAMLVPSLAAERATRA